MSISSLPALTDRPRMAVPKFTGPSKAEKNGHDEKADAKGLERFRAAVFARDKGKCRCCGRTVKKTLKPVPERAEANHIAGRRDRVVRHDPRNGVLLCAVPCHQQVTRRELFIVQVAALMFMADNGLQYINGDKAVTFKPEAQR